MVMFTPCGVGKPSVQLAVRENTRFAHKYFAARENVDVGMSRRQRVLDSNCTSNCLKVTSAEVGRPAQREKVIVRSEDVQIGAVVLIEITKNDGIRRLCVDFGIDRQ